MCVHIYTHTPHILVMHGGHLGRMYGSHSIPCYFFGNCVYIGGAQ